MNPQRPLSVSLVKEVGCYNITEILYRGGVVRYGLTHRQTRARVGSVKKTMQEIIHLTNESDNSDFFRAAGGVPADKRNIY